MGISMAVIQIALKQYKREGVYILTWIYSKVCI